MSARSSLCLRELEFRYRRGSEELLGGLDFDFSPGQVTAITGPSGRGKSTLLYVIGLLLTPSGGQVLLDGRPVARLADRQRARLRAEKFGFVFQDAALDPSRRVLDGVIEPALYAGRRRRPAAEQARGLLNGMGLGERADHRPGEVSGGQAQRVALCRCLLNDPDIILADEPTGNLDRDNAALVLGALRQAADAGRTVVIATHDPFALGQVDAVLALGPTAGESGRRNGPPAGQGAD